MKIFIAEKCVATAARAATSFLQRARGLIGERAFPEGAALILNPCSSIHTFFMRFPIDVVFSDGNGRVLRCIKNVGPWRVGPACFRAKMVIELPAGTIARHGIFAGQIVKITERR